MWRWGSDTGGLIGKLARPVHYRRSIEKLHRKLASDFSGKMHAPQPEGYHFAQAFFARRKLARMLARAVSRGEYRFSPARLADIHADGKIRTVCSFSLLDRVVHGAAHGMLMPDMQSQIPPQVYSYVKGRDKHQALHAMGDYLRAHRKAHPDPKSRGLYVLRSDIASYGLSIPVHAASPLWEQIDDAFRRAYGRTPSAGEAALLESLIRPAIEHPEGGLYQRFVGIADGSAVTAWLLNLYAAPLDAALSSIKGGFYARYSDDILFMHPDAEIFSAALARMDEALAGLSLARNIGKTQCFFFNGAGRPAADFRGTTHVEYLGFKVAFDGQLSLKTEKTRKLLRDLRRRAHATAQVMRDAPREARARAICRMLSDVMDPYARRPHAYASILRYLADDRRCLRQMDYHLARLVLRAATGDVSAKAFRKLPYRRLRQWGLRSLEHARND